MDDEAKISWALNLLKRAQMGKISGAVEIRFNNGDIQGSEIRMYEKPVDGIGNKA